MQSEQIEIVLQKMKKTEFTWQLTLWSSRAENLYLRRKKDGMALAGLSSGQFGFESKKIEDGLGSHSHGHRLRSVVCNQLPLSAHHIHCQENRRGTQNTGRGAAVCEGGW